MVKCTFEDKTIIELEDDGMLGLDMQFIVNDTSYKVIDVITKDDDGTITELKLQKVSQKEKKKEEKLEKRQLDRH